eukprot:s235_g26.t1
MPASSHRSSESAKIAWRHKTGSVGDLLGQKAPAPATKNFKRDNVRMIRSMSREVHRSRVESEKSSDPHFKLQKFANVASRLHDTPKRLQDLQASRMSNVSQATPTRLRSLSMPGFSPAKTSPPGQSPWARGPLRSCNQPIPRPVPKGKKEAPIQRTPEMAEIHQPEKEGQENRPGARLIFSPPPREDSRSFEVDDEKRSEEEIPSQVPGWWPDDSLSSPFAFSDFECLPARRQRRPSPPRTAATPLERTWR